MAKSYNYSFRDMEKILKRNGYQYVRGHGSHMIYSDGIHTAVVPIHLKKMLALRIIKQCDLVLEL